MGLSVHSLTFSACAAEGNPEPRGKWASWAESVGFGNRGSHHTEWWLPPRPPLLCIGAGWPPPLLAPSQLCSHAQRQHTQGLKPAVPLESRWPYPSFPENGSLAHPLKHGQGGWWWSNGSYPASPTTRSRAQWGLGWDRSVTGGFPAPISYLHPLSEVQKRKNVFSTKWSQVKTQS